MSDPSWHDVGAAAELADGDLRPALVAGERLCVGRSGETFFAVEDTCPHAGGSLSEGMVDGGWLICPLHAYGFDVRSGECPDDPGCRVRAFPVRVEGGVVQVRV
jgi:nitrite reductase/ring-hydroxylating ferredoxin subunit